MRIIYIIISTTVLQHSSLTTTTTNYFSLFNIIIIRMSIAFWSRELKCGTEVEASVPEGYVLNFQTAAISPDNGDKEGSYLTVKIKTQDIEGEDLYATIGTLRPKINEQFTTAIGIFSISSININIKNNHDYQIYSNWL